MCPFSEWVGDIVAGVMAAIDYEPQPARGARFELFNLGNSRPVRLAEMVKLLEPDRFVCLSGPIVQDHEQCATCTVNYPSRC